MRLLHGKPLAEQVHARSHERCLALAARGIIPRLAAVLVGSDPSANTYLQRLASRGRRLGVEVHEIALPVETTERELAARLDALDRDPAVHGILLLAPLPGALERAHVIDHIVPLKDVEGMTPVSVGLLADGRPRFVPSTAEAVVELLRFHGVRMAGARAVVVGRSTVVGRPVASLLLAEHATVTIAHSRTPDLLEITRDGEVLVVAVGRAGFVRAEMVRPGATVIDAGINVTPTGIVGDVDAESVAAVAGALSPVPGGLGGVTTELLLRNVIAASERQRPE